MASVDSNTKKPAQFERAFFEFRSGDFLLSHTGNRAVSSAPTGLTSVFGMGTGVTLSTKSPENLANDQFRMYNDEFKTKNSSFDIHHSEFSKLDI